MNELLEAIHRTQTRETAERVKILEQQITALQKAVEQILTLLSKESKS